MQTIIIIVIGGCGGRGDACWDVMHRLVILARLGLKWEGGEGVAPYERQVDVDIVTSRIGEMCNKVEKDNE